MITLGIDKYRYSIGIGGRAVSVKLAKPITITGKRDDTSYRYSRKSSVWKLMRYENYSIFQQILSMVTYPSDATDKIYVTCDLYDDWTTKTSTEYRGYVPLSGILINEDTGVLEMTPTEQSDYDWYDKHKGDKVDVYNEVVDTSEGIRYDFITTTEEYYLVVYLRMVGPYPVDRYYPSEFLTSEELINIENFSASKNYLAGYTIDSYCYRPSGTPVVLTIYRCIKDCQGASYAPPNSEYWVKIIDSTDPLYWYHNLRRVYRQVYDLPFYSTQYNDFGSGLFEAGFPDVTENIDGYDNCNKYACYSKESSVVTGTMYLCSPTKTDYVLSTGPNHSLKNILSHLLQINYSTKTFSEGSGLTISSLFLQATNNPVTTATNKFTNPRMLHNRVVKGIQDSETKGEMTLEQLLRDLCETFNLSWAIIGTTFYLEHINFFINGFSYSPATTVYTDLTNTTTYPLKYQTVYDIDGSESDNEYRFSLTSCPEKETFHFPDGYDYDGIIKYESSFVKENDEVSHDITTFMTDYQYILGNRVDSQDDIWCLIAVGADSYIHRRTASLRPISERTFKREATNFPNGDLAWNNLLNDFWKYNNPFGTGHINYNEASTVGSSPRRKIFRQREIKFPRLQAGAFDPYKTITTNMGNGVVESFEIDTDTDFIKVELLYGEES